MRTLLVSCAAALLLGCGSAPGEAGKQPGENRSVLTFEELERSGLQDAFTAIQSLRPHWLRRRGPSSINAPQEIRVYLNSNLMGGPSFLRNITIHSVKSIRYLNGMEATSRYGLDHGEGAILIVTQ